MTAPTPPTVAVLDDDPVARRLLGAWLGAAGYTVEEYASSAPLLARELSELDFACVDLGLGEESGLDVISTLRRRDPDLPLLVVTAARALESAVEAMRAGAWDYLAKPVDPALLAQAARRASERRSLSRDVRVLRARLGEQEGLGAILGRSDAIQQLRREIARVLDSDVNVCVFGESGTGKELVARALHEAGKRKNGPFVALNCGAIPASLQESELFGHERGAFTGATGTHRGRFEQANHGTLFLDEVGEMSAATQASLLRTLQERTVRRVGGSADIPVDVRIVCATHRDLEADVAAGRFRQDLYYRLVVFPVRVPPLRERLDDLPILVGHFLRQLSRDVGRSVERVRPEVFDVLAMHGWPGNVRELQNVIHRAMLCTDGQELDVTSLPEALRTPGALRASKELGAATLPVAPARAPTPAAATTTANVEAKRDVVAASPALSATGVVSLAALERDAIRRALEQCGGNVTRAAKLLGLGRATLYRRLATLDIETP